MEPRRLTTILIYLASVVEKADEQILPAVYFFSGKSWSATPTEMGQITLCRALVQAIASPLSGWLGDKYDRTAVIAAGCYIWGVMTSGIAASNTAMIYAAVNGLGLSLVIPCSQSIIADLYIPTLRGRAYGLMQFISAAGVVGGGLFATNMGRYSPLGIDGWRMALHTVAVISIATGLLVQFHGREPRTLKTKTRQPNEDVESAKMLESTTGSSSTGAIALDWLLVVTDFLFGDVDTMLTSLWKFLQIPSFNIIILQGIIGTLPWNAMVFFTLWFQLLGFSDFVASLLLSIFSIGCACGGVIGGTVGDTLATRFPDSGRIMTAQISCLSGFPLFCILFKILPPLTLSAKPLLFGIVLFVLGCVVSWNSAACNTPMFSELVPPELYSKIFAFDRSFEGALASMAAPLVGHIAENYFGFTGSIGENKEYQSANASALGDSLFACITIPLLLCCLSYTGLYWTFPKDKRKTVSKNISYVD